MTKKLIALLLAAACLPSLTYAQIYKCKSSSGSVSYQNDPCQSNAANPALKLPPLPPPSEQKKYTAPPSSSSSTRQPTGAAQFPHTPERRRELEAELRRTNDELQKANARMKQQDPNWQNSERARRLDERAKQSDEYVKNMDRQKK
jgi:hypothetical protein